MDMPAPKVRNLLKIAQGRSRSKPRSAERTIRMWATSSKIARSCLRPKRRSPWLSGSRPSRSSRHSRRAKKKSSGCGSAWATAASARSKKSVRVLGSPASASARSRPRHSASCATRHATKSFVRFVPSVWSKAALFAINRRRSLLSEDDSDKGCRRHNLPKGASTMPHEDLEVVVSAQAEEPAPQNADSMSRCRLWLVGRR
jgi:hypothetical protein